MLIGISVGYRIVVLFFVSLMNSFLPHPNSTVVIEFTNSLMIGPGQYVMYSVSLENNQGDFVGLVT